MADGSMPWANRSDDEAIGVGGFVRVRRAGGVVVIFVAGAPVLRLALEDVVGLRVALAGLVSTDVITQADVASSGLVAESTFHRGTRSRVPRRLRDQAGSGSELLIG
jgi:hypothetical protein